MEGAGVTNVPASKRSRCVPCEGFLRTDQLASIKGGFVGELYKYITNGNEVELKLSSERLVLVGKTAGAKPFVKSPDCSRVGPHCEHCQDEERQSFYRREYKRQKEVAKALESNETAIDFLAICDDDELEAASRTQLLGLLEAAQDQFSTAFFQSSIRNYNNNNPKSSSSSSSSSTVAVAVAVAAAPAGVVGKLLRAPKTRTLKKVKRISNTFATSRRL